MMRCFPRAGRRRMKWGMNAELVTTRALAVATSAEFPLPVGWVIFGLATLAWAALLVPVTLGLRLAGLL